MANPDPVRVLVVEDSAPITDVVVNLCHEDPGIKVVATAVDGAEGIRKILECQPDFIICDLGLPKVDGFEVIEWAMTERPTPIMVLTATLHPSGRPEAFHALSLGALQVTEKPTREEINSYVWRRRFLQNIRALSKIPVIPRPGRIKAQSIAKKAGITAKPKPVERRPAAARRPAPLPKRPSSGVGYAKSGDLQRHDQAAGRSIRLVPRAPVPPQLVAIIGSAGGPQAMQALLAELPPLEVPVVLGLHLGRQFEGALSSFLGQKAKMPVVAAEKSLVVKPGTVYVLPGRGICKFTRKEQLYVVGATTDDHGASLDVYLESVARTYGNAALAVILTGMGDDGVKGMVRMREAGAVTLAQSPSTCLCDMMPQGAMSAGAVMLDEAPGDLAATIGRLVRGE